MLPFDINAFRQLFPLLSSSTEEPMLCYLDNAATTQKMASTIDVITNYYQQHNANVHRGSYRLSANTTALFESARQQVQQLINAKSEKEIIWTKGTTEAINLVANSWGGTYLKSGDEILLSYAEHHANIVPWQLVTEKVGAVIRIIPLLTDGTIDLIALEALITNKTKLICCSHISNVIGKINPIEKIIEIAQRTNIKTLIDGAQAIAHIAVDVQTLGCDFYVFSSHKMYGPTGLGVLYGKEALLKQMPPYQGGGEMIKQVSFSGTTFNELPFKFEAGTPNISATLGFKHAIEQFLQWNLASLKEYEQGLIDYTFQALSAIKSLHWLVEGKPDVGIFSFVISKHHNQDVASFLDTQGIAVRSGHHCAMPLMAHLNVDGCIRVSLTAYNTKQEIDRLITALNVFLTTDFNAISSEISSTNLNHVPNEKQKGCDNVLSASTQANVEKHSSTAERIISDFSQAKSWDAKHRLIMLCGKELQRLPKNQRDNTSLIHGCESKAWLIAKQDVSLKYSFEGDSDARVIRGLMFIALALYQGLTKEEVLNVNIEAYFETLGLMQHLSPSRGNGLNAIVERIKQLVC